MNRWKKKEIALTASILCCIWIGVPIWIWRNLPSDEDARNKRLYDIEQTLKTQHQMIQIALMEEILSDSPSPYRIRRLEQLKKILDKIEEF